MRKVIKQKAHFYEQATLGYLHQEQIYITGRLKELIIVAGANHYPQDIERSIQNAHQDLTKNAGAAFSIEVNGQEKLVVAQEIKRTSLKSFNPQEIFSTIRKTISEIHELAIHDILLLTPGRIPKTSSGKIQRKLLPKVVSGKCCRRFTSSITQRK